jgi:hypothetical protein
MRGTRDDTREEMSEEKKRGETTDDRTKYS